MKRKSCIQRLAFFLIGMQICVASWSQSKGLKTITEKELKYHLEFIGANEFRGRETPSSENEIASLYLGNCFREIGLKPVMKDGSFFQSVPLTVTSVFQPNTKIRFVKNGSERIFYFGRSFTGNFLTSGSYSGNIVFAGAGICDPGKGWDDLQGLELSGKIVVILDELRPGDKSLAGTSLSSRLNTRITEIRNRGAVAVFTVVSREREEKMRAGNISFEYIPTGRLGLLYDSQRTSFSPAVPAADQKSRPPLPFAQAEINQELASTLLDITPDELDNMFSDIRQDKQVPSKDLPDTRAQLDTEVEKYVSASRNIVGMVEGSDPVLKYEYIIISGHHDGRGIDDGEIIPGADDNATASVALLEIGQALLAERPRRSVILVSFTGEEQGMNGSHYFINNCPVPVEKISSCLNMDMIGRNNSDSLFLVGSDLLSSELDGSIRKANRNPGLNFGFDYRYSSLDHPQNVYFRSDHYPFIRFGIPSVWFFSGFTPDYHTPRDVLEFINYNKFLKITKLVYLTAYDIGNMPELLKLDVNPAVKSRGSGNLTETSLFQGKPK